MDKQKFAIFILSHNRADRFDTLKLLNKSGCDYDWFVVISTDDKQIEEYKKIVPNDKILLFNKQEIKCDTMLSRHFFQPNTAIYARNFIVDYAKDKYKYFCMMDDDIKRLYFRIDVGGCMKTLDATSYIKEICENLCEFLGSSKHLGGVGLKNNGGYFGGIIALNKPNREIQQFMIFKSDDVRNFNGLVYEDAILSCVNFDKLYLECPCVSVLSPQEGKNSGGVSYDRKKYPPSLFWYVVCPSALKIIGLDGKRKRINKYMYPVIINKKYKKL